VVGGGLVVLHLHHTKNFSGGGEPNKIVADGKPFWEMKGSRNQPSKKTWVRLGNGKKEEEVRKAKVKVETVIRVLNVRGPGEMIRLRAR